MTNFHLQNRVPWALFASVFALSFTGQMALSAREHPIYAQNLINQQAQLPTAQQVYFTPELSADRLGAAFLDGFKVGTETGLKELGNDSVKSLHAGNLERVGQVRELQDFYIDGYLMGLEDGNERYKAWLESDERANAKDKDGLTKGYRDGYDDGYEDGAENDFKTSWNPRSKNAAYLKDYAFGYREGYESGCEDYWEDYAVDGEFDAYDEW